MSSKYPTIINLKKIIIINHNHEHGEILKNKKVKEKNKFNIKSRKSKIREKKNFRNPDIILKIKIKTQSLKSNLNMQETKQEKKIEIKNCK